MTLPMTPTGDEQTVVVPIMRVTMNEAAGDRELARLRANETWMDEHTKSQLAATGLGSGWWATTTLPGTSRHRGFQGNEVAKRRR